MNKFGKYTRSTAFNISLSQNMIDRLLGIESNMVTTRLSLDRVLDISATNKALERRGLIEILPENQLDEEMSEVWIMQLTEAGKLLCPLLKVAGFKARSFLKEDLFEN